MQGEIDKATADRFEDALLTAMDAGRGAVIIDLTRVEFMDSSGLHAIVKSMRWLRARDRSLAVVYAPGSPVERLFEITGTSEVIPSSATRAAATGEAEPDRP